MQMQLNLDFTRSSSQQQKPILKNATWMDVSDVAKGTGFTATVKVGVALNDALEPLQNERDGDYDQRLYDALWLAHFRLSLDQRRSAAFNFTFTRKRLTTEEITEVSLRLRVEVQMDRVLVGLSQDF